jgi:hypothetical protein
MAYHNDIQLIIDGEPVNQQVTNRPLSNLKDNTDWLKAQVDGITGGSIPAGNATSLGGFAASAYVRKAGDAWYSGQGGKNVVVAGDGLSLTFGTSTDTDEHVKMSATDASAGYMDAKVDNSSLETYGAVGAAQHIHVKALGIASGMLADDAILESKLAMSNAPSGTTKVIMWDGAAMTWTALVVGTNVSAGLDNVGDGPASYWRVAGVEHNTHKTTVDSYLAGSVGDAALTDYGIKAIKFYQGGSPVVPVPTGTYPLWDGSKFVWTAPAGSGYWTLAGSDIYYSGGNVGLGGAAVNEKATVSGRLSLQETTAPSATAGFGKVYVKGAADHKIYFMDYNGNETCLLAASVADNTINGSKIVDRSINEAKFHTSSGSAPTVGQFLGWNVGSSILEWQNTPGAPLTIISTTNDQYWRFASIAKYTSADSISYSFNFLSQDPYAFVTAADDGTSFLGVNSESAGKIRASIRQQGYVGGNRGMRTYVSGFYGVIIEAYERSGGLYYDFYLKFAVAGTKLVYNGMISNQIISSPTPTAPGADTLVGTSLALQALSFNDQTFMQHSLGYWNAQNPTNGNNLLISNVLDPVSNQDAMTKAFFNNNTGTTTQTAINNAGYAHYGTASSVALTMSPAPTKKVFLIGTNNGGGGANYTVSGYWEYVGGVWVGPADGFIDPYSSRLSVGSTIQAGWDGVSVVSSRYAAGYVTVHAWWT